MRVISKVRNHEEVEVAYYGHPYPYWFGYPHRYVSPGVHTALSWYITPNLRTSIALYPSRFIYRHHAPHHHLVTWSRMGGARPVKIITTSKRRGVHRRR